MGFATFKIEGSEVVKAEEIQSKDFDELLGALSESEPRFIVADFEYETTDGRPADKVVFISWYVHGGPHPSLRPQSQLHADRLANWMATHCTHA